MDIEAWGDLVGGELEPYAPVVTDGAASSTAFLSRSIRMQAELEMALRSQMEMIAEGVPDGTHKPSTRRRTKACSQFTSGLAPGPCRRRLSLVL